MLTVGYLLGKIEAAIAEALPARKAYAMSGAFEIAAPLLPGDPEGAQERVKSPLIASAESQNGMLRFSLTEAALYSALPEADELLAMERAQEGLLDALFAGDLPIACGESAALAYARLCIIMRTPRESGNAARELLWLSAQAFSRKPLAAEKLTRALKPYLSDLSANPNAALRYCRAALGEELNIR